MEMDFSLVQFIILFVGVFFAGLVDSIAGGGGLITLPLYISLGVPDHLILGTNKTVSTIGTSTAVLRFIKNKAIAWREGLIAISFSLCGSVLGAKSSHLLSSEYMSYLLVFILPIILFLNKGTDFSVEQTKGALELPQIIIRSSLIGFVIGFYDGFFGPGTGTFLLIALFLGLRLNVKSASATSRLINFSSNMASFIYFFINGKVVWEIAIVAIFASILGNWVGSGLVLSKAKEIIKPIFNGVVLLLFGKCLYTVIF